MNRYSNIFNITYARQNVKGTTISDRESDLYITYTSADRLDNISNRIYGSPNYWWVILEANGYSIEFDIEYGEILRIPYPLSDVLNELRDE